MSDEILHAKLDEYVRSVIHEDGFISYNIETRRITSNGGGYMGILFEVDIKGETNDNEKETNIFAKLIVPTAIQMKIYSVIDIFNREAFAYKELSKVFKDLQNEHNIPIEKQFRMVKCFDICNPEAIILENISKKGFITYNRMDVVQLKYAELSIQHLAEFHGMSMVLKVKRSEYFEGIVKDLKQPFNFGKDWDDFVNNILGSSINYLDRDLINKYGEKIKNKVNKYSEYMNDTSSVNTLCHGDYKHGNVMALEIVSTNNMIIECFLSINFFHTDYVTSQFR